MPPAAGADERRVAGSLVAAVGEGTVAALAQLSALLTRHRWRNTAVGCLGSRGSAEPWLSLG
ncbi:hypothetical protein [Streptomyces sp. NPDC102476]|uniref:hypothetical protein n=1 Tax=Streptomyces sp. NPDC102476 TaxID=3366181 RepID=UPI003823AF3C